MGLIIGSSASGTAQADYVDFTGAASYGVYGEWSTSAGGVDVVVRSQSGFLWGGSDVGFAGYAHSANLFTGPYAQGLSITFSQPVEILSATLVDVWRASYTFCSQVPCPAVPIDSETLSYSVDGAAATAFAPSASGSGAVTVDPNGTYAGYPGAVVASVGYSDGTGNLPRFTYDRTIEESGREITFTAAFIPTSTSPSWYDSNTHNFFGLRGISFSTDRVPELDSSVAAIAVALMIGLLALAHERRRVR